MSALPVEVVQCLADTQGVQTSDLTAHAWTAVAEHVSNRMERVVGLAQRLAHAQRSAALTPDHINAALHACRLPPLVGHRTQDVPKLHYVKEHKLYARNDGVVDVRAWALNAAACTKLTASCSLHGPPHRYGVERMQDLKAEPASTSTAQADDAALQRLMHVLSLLMREKNMRVVQKVFSDKFQSVVQNSAHVETVVQFLLQKLNNTFTCLAALTCLRCCAASGSPQQLEPQVPRLLRACAALLKAAQHTQQVDCCLANLLVDLVTISSTHVTPVLCVQLERVLLAPFQLNIYMRCLAVCQRLGWPVVSHFDWSAVFDWHRKHQRHLFDKPQADDPEAVAYLAQLQMFLTWYMRRLSYAIRHFRRQLLEEQAESTAAEWRSSRSMYRVSQVALAACENDSNSLDISWKSIAVLYSQLHDAFGCGPHTLPLLNPVVSIVDSTKTTDDVHAALETVSPANPVRQGQEVCQHFIELEYARAVRDTRAALGRRGRDQQQQGEETPRPSSAADSTTAAATVGRKPVSSKPTGKRPGSSGSVARGGAGSSAKKRRLKKAQDWFEVPRSFRGAYKDAAQFIFVFHNTNATVLKDTQGTPLCLQPASNKQPDWLNFARRQKRSVKVKASSSRVLPYFSGLDAAHLML